MVHFNFMCIAPVWNNFDTKYFSVWRIISIYYKIIKKRRYLNYRVYNTTLTIGCRKIGQK